jgi:hypothetical protein
MDGGSFIKGCWIFFFHPFSAVLYYFPLTVLRFKGIIERPAIDGQKVYHSDLEKAMWLYIQEHQSEFPPEGIEPVVIDLNGGLPEPIEVNGVQPDSKVTEDEFKQRERERNQRGLQWAWDTFDGAYQVAKQSTQGALGLVRDAWDQSSSTTILWFVIVILVLSNIWTLMRMGASRDEVSRKFNLKLEVEELHCTLDVIEGRVKILRESLKNLDSLDWFLVICHVSAVTCTGSHGASAYYYLRVRLGNLWHSFEMPVFPSSTNFNT